MKKVKILTATLAGISLWDPATAILVAIPIIIAAAPGSIPAGTLFVLIFKSRRKIFCRTGFHNWKIETDEDAIEMLSCHRNCGTNIVCHREKLPLTFKLQKFVKKTLKGRIK